MQLKFFISSKHFLSKVSQNFFNQNCKTVCLNRFLGKIDFRFDLTLFVSFFKQIWWLCKKKPWIFFSSLSVLKNLFLLTQLWRSKGELLKDMENLANNLLISNTFSLSSCADEIIVLWWITLWKQWNVLMAFGIFWKAMNVGTQKCYV